MNTNLSFIFALVLAASLSACGGSSPSSGQALEQDAENGQDPSEDNVSEEFDYDSMNTSFSVHFPWQSSVVAGTNFTLQGEVSDLPNSYQLLVNGEAVQLIDLLETQYSYQWHYATEVVGADINEFTVEVLNSAGDRVGSPEVIEVARKASIPIAFDFDPLSRRLVGMAGTDLVDLDIESGEAAKDASLMNSLPIGACHKTDTDELIYVTTGYSKENSDKTYYVFRRAPLSGDSLPAVFHEEPKLPGTSQDVDLLCHPSKDRVYLATNRHFFSENEEKFSSIYELNTASEASEPWSVLFSGERWIDGGLAIGGVALEEDHILVYSHPSGKSQMQGIHSVSLDMGEVDTVVHGYEQFAARIAQGSRLDAVYTISFEGLDILKPNDQHRRISKRSEDHNFLEFDQIRSAALDIEANRLLVSDSGQNMIIGIDLETGEREAVFSPGKGEGPRMVHPTGFVLDSDYQSAYVLDSGGNTPEKIVHVDLDTGDREVIAVLQNDEGNRGTADIVLDEEGGLLYAVRGNSVYRVDLETRGVEIIASELRGYGPDYGNIDGLALDDSNSRLLFSSPYHPDAGDTSRSGAIFAIDLADENYTRSLISVADHRGEGPTLHTAIGMALPVGESVVYVGDQYAGAIYEVDLETGDRTALTIECDMPRLKDQELLMGLSLNADESSLLITWDGTTVVDRNSGRCLNYIDDWYSHGYVPAKGNSLFSIEQGGLYLLDSQTLEKVIISQ